MTVRLGGADGPAVTLAVVAVAVATAGASEEETRLAPPTGPVSSRRPVAAPRAEPERRAAPLCPRRRALIALA